MKRLLTIIICIAFLAYSVVFLSSFKPFVNQNFLGTKSLLKRARGFVALGGLFVHETSMQGYATSYRFFQDGKWQSWQDLEEPLFNEYINTGRLASLRHNRLDRKLGRRMVRVGLGGGVAKLTASKEFKTFASHLFFSHNQGRKPDSLEIIHNRKFAAQRKKTVLRFKCKP